MAWPSLLTLGLALATPAIASATSFKAQVDAILDRPAFNNATVGIMIRSLPSNEVVYERDAHRSLVPASNQKLATAAIALYTLGSDFRYQTSVLSAGDIDDEGTLRGDLYLRGSGDPTLSMARLQELANATRKAGVKRITGHIIGDGSVFDDQFLGPGWAWDDEPWYYSAQVAGLNCDSNVVNVEVIAGKAAGDATHALVNGRPASKEAYVVVKNGVETVNEPVYAYFNRMRGRNIIPVTGAIQVSTGSVSQDITVEAPTTFTASRFALALQDAGVTLDAPRSFDEGSTPPEATDLVSSKSVPLSEILALFLKPSDNLFGEALLKTVGRNATSSQPGSTSTGADALGRFLESAGITTDGVSTVDGSGLSAMNTMTAKFISDLLIHVDQVFGDSDRAIYLDALPIGGVDGTLKDRFVDSPVAGNVCGKTGSLTGVSSLSGFLTAENHERYVFSILMNHATSADEAQKGQDDIVTALFHR